MSPPFPPPADEAARVTDTHGRPLGDLRLSVTDRCNLRCAYCMPEEDYTWLDKSQILHFEEMSRVCDVFAGLGVRKVRLTGGEPLIRRDLPALIAMLADKPAIADLAMTTNGVLLARHARALRDAGLRRLTVSLDTLNPERFAALTRRDALADVLAGLRAAVDAGFAAPGPGGEAGLKIDAVVIRGVTDDSLHDLLALGRSLPAEVRFIEYMDVGGATQWSPAAVVSRAEILARIEQRLGPVTPLPSAPSATASRYALADGTAFGIIASTTRPFCGACNRSRLTADGTWYLCLYAPTGTDLREPLRRGATDDDLRALVERVWRARTDRGAETRLAGGDRGPLIPADALRRDPRLEMHTRGG